MMIKHTTQAFFILLLAFLIGIFATKFEYFFPSSTSLYRDIDLYLKENRFQGAILIAKEGKIVFQQGYGFANEEYQIPNTPHTVFRIGSLTKQFTAVAILLLQEKEMLNICDPIAKYLPGYPQGDKITIHHLLSHTSGIISITDFSNLQEIQRHPSNPLQVLAYFKNLPLEFAPGTNCKYSDSGYIVLGAIIEAITKRSYEDFIRENIFLPLKMNSTYYDHNQSIICKRATGYICKDKDKKIHANYIDMSFPHAAGALASTVDNLYKWDQALKEATILSKKSRDSLFRIQGSSNEHKINYGYGFFIGPNNFELDQARETIVGHSGTIDGFRAASFRYVDNDLTIIILSNVENTHIHNLHLGIADIIYASWRSAP